MPLRIVFSAILLAFLALPILAADPITPPLGQAAPASNSGPQTAAFHKLHSEMNALLAELAGLQIKYRTANEEKRADIQQQWKELIAKGQIMEPKLIDSAKKAYAESPNTDKEITEFLVKMLGQMVEHDDYEPAADIGKLLMDNKCAEKQVPNLAGIAAFAASDFDTAEKYFAVAEKSGFYESASPKDKQSQIGGYYGQIVGNYKQAWAKEKAIRDAEAKADDLPRVLLKTNKGDIVIELFENQAPNSVANFISLVKKGFYNGLSFHRVLGGFMAQGGDPKGDGSGGPGYSIACECYRPDHRLHFRGTLSMAHAGRDTGGSQFFLTFVPTSHLDGKHTAFGRVIEGMDVLAKLQRRDPNEAEPPRADKIIEAKVLRKRPHDYKPQKMPE
jgi:cyclophilin family peptidyl-prolyl cis-trans isomerase